MTSERKRWPVTTSSAVGNGTADGGHLLVLGPGRRFVGHPVHAVVGQAAIEAVDLLRRVDRAGRRPETGIQREAVAGEARRRIQRIVAAKGHDAAERRMVQPCHRYMLASFPPAGWQDGAPT